MSTDTGEFPFFTFSNDHKELREAGDTASERMMRDAKITQIDETNQIQRVAMARQLRKG